MYRVKAIAQESDNPVGSLKEYDMMTVFESSDVRLRLGSYFNSLSISNLYTYPNL